MPIIVNNVEITDDEVHAEMQYHSAASVEAARHKAAQALVIRQLLLQAARNKKLLDDPEHADIEKVEETIDTLIQQEVIVPQADQQSCKRYYEQNMERFVDKRTHQLLPFDSVFFYIRDYLQARSLQTGINQYIKLLAGGARIAGFDLEGSDNPLVQ
jgi:peptidyl-prolyl cis-trans isomerase C